MIKLVVFDIDGVLTDGTVFVDACGNEMKMFSLTELDALNEIAAEYMIAAITGEETSITDFFRRKIKWIEFAVGCKDKVQKIKEYKNKYRLSTEEICYIGDGKYDVQVIEYVGLGVCPQNAIEEVKVAADIILDGTGGKNCISQLKSVLFEQKKVDEYHSKCTEAGMGVSFNYLQKCLESHMKLFISIRRSAEVQKKIIQAAEIVKEVILSGGALFLCGNGGSASDSQHIATEFVSKFYKERKAINAEALTVNTSSLTAISNDYDFAQVFVRQLEAKAKAGDVLIGISTSGTSLNVVRAIEYAALNGIRTILFTGDSEKEYDKNLYECVVNIPCTDTPRIQEAHIFVGHMIAEYVEAVIEKSSVGSI